MNGLRQMFRRDSDSDSSRSEEEELINEASSDLHAMDCYESTETGITIRLNQDRIRGIAHQLWPAALVLVKYLERSHSILFPAGISNECFVELGAGIGLVGLVTAALGARKVIVTDIPDALESLQRNIRLNPSLEDKIEAAVLTWGNENEALRCSQSLPSPPYILASDCVYWEHLFDPLRKTIQLFVDAGSVVFMSHVKRWKKDTKFFHDCAKTMKVQVLDEEIRYHDSRREIHRIYRISK